MKYIELICNNCSKKFQRPIKEYNRNFKKNRKVYCSLSCSGSKNYQHLNQSRVTKHLVADNRQDQYSPFRYFIKMCKLREKNNQHNYNINLEYLKNLWDRQKGLCAYTGIDMHLPKNTKERDTKPKFPHTASLDRIDSSRGYVKGNVQFVCLSLNLGKNKFSDNAFKDFLHKIKNFNS